MPDVIDLIFAGFLLLAVTGVLLGLYFEKKRREAWQALAEALGFEFRKIDRTFAGRYACFGMFQVGRGKKAKNVLTGENAGIRICLTDYQYTTGSGKNSTTHRRTLCIVENEAMDLPVFRMRPERFFDGIGALLGGKDFDFDDDPDFSKAFVLQGDDEEAVRALFDAGTRQWIVERGDRKLHAEGAGGMLLLHRGGRIRPDRARELMETAFGLMGRWA